MTTAGVTQTINPVTCNRCNSEQIVSNKRGYSFKIMILTFLTLFVTSILFTLLSVIFEFYRNGFGAFLVLPVFLFILSLPISLIAGLIGRNNLLNGCMNCGLKWKPWQ